MEQISIEQPLEIIEFPLQDETKEINCENLEDDVDVDKSPFHLSEDGKERIFTAECEKSVIIIKTFIELMYHITTMDSSTTKVIKQIYFKITQDGLEIFSCNTEKIQGYFKLRKSFFNNYKLYQEEDLCIGISLDIIKTCFKNIARNDVMLMYIEKEEFVNFPNRINVVLNSVKGFSVKFNILQNILPESYDNFKDLCIISQKKNHNIFRELGGGKKIVHIETCNGKIKLKSSLVDIAENWIMFDLIEKDFEMKNFSLKCEYFKLITKLGVFNNNNIIISYDKDNNILMFKSKIFVKEEEFGDTFITIKPLEE